MIMMLETRWKPARLGPSGSTSSVRKVPMDFEIFTHYSGRMPQDFHQRSLNGVALVDVIDVESDRI